MASFVDFIVFIDGTVNNRVVLGTLLSPGSDDGRHGGQRSREMTLAINVIESETIGRESITVGTNWLS